MRARLLTFVLVSALSASVAGFVGHPANAVKAGPPVASVTVSPAPTLAPTPTVSPAPTPAPTLTGSPVPTVTASAPPVSAEPTVVPTDPAATVAPTIPPVPVLTPLPPLVLPPKGKVKPNRPDLRWKVPVGPRFNNPMVEAERYNIERHILRAIKNTPKGEQITISAYSMDRPAFAAALIAAYRRGVQVQVLLNDHIVPGAQVTIQKVIGDDTTQANFLHRCDSGCRTDKNEFNNLHSKFYLFSRTGRNRNVVMLGSANMTLNAVKWQWNDLYTMVEEPMLYAEFKALFDDMRPDWSARRPSYEFCAIEGRQCAEGDKLKYFNTVFPRYTTPQTDEVMQILRNVQCTYVDAAGKKKATVMRISMHTMRGNRGNYLADEIRRLYANGCNIKVQYGLMGFHTKQHMGAPTSRGRIPLRSTGFNLDDDPLTIERYTHHKYLVLKGSYKGDRYARMVWTGSSNWASLGTPQDEIIFSLHGSKWVKQYMANWNTMWKAPYSRDAYTTTYSNWRVAMPGPQMEFQRTPMVTVQSDGLKPGSTWEND